MIDRNSPVRSCIEVASMMNMVADKAQGMRTRQSDVKGSTAREVAQGRQWKSDQQTGSTMAEEKLWWELNEDGQRG